MPPRDFEVALSLRHAIVICRLLFNCTFSTIERKIEVQSKTTQIIIQRVVKRIENKNFYNILACVETIKSCKTLLRVLDNTKLFANIRNTILKYLHTQLFKTILNKENIDILSKKQLSRVFLERVQH